MEGALPISSVSSSFISGSLSVWAGLGAVDLLVVLLRVLPCKHTRVSLYLSNSFKHKTVHIQLKCTNKWCTIRSEMYITQVNKVHFQFILTALRHEQHCHNRTIQSTSIKMDWYAFKAKNNLCYSKVLLTQNSVHESGGTILTIRHRYQFLYQCYSFLTNDVVKDRYKKKL